MGRWAQYRHRGRGCASGLPPWPAWTFDAVQSDAGEFTATLEVSETFPYPQWQLRYSSAGAGVWTETAVGDKTDSFIVGVAPGDYDTQARGCDAGGDPTTDWSATVPVTVA